MHVYSSQHVPSTATMTARSLLAHLEATDHAVRMATALTGCDAAATTAAAVAVADDSIVHSLASRRL